MSRIGAEEVRTAAADKAKQAEEEKARLAAERANKAEQDKAAAAAKAAETAKLAAEKARQAEEAKAAAAEQRRKEAEAAVAKALAEKQAAEKALADRIANDTATAELAAKQTAEKKAQADDEQKLAAVAPTAAHSSLSPQEIGKLMQSELRRVGCLNVTADDGWNEVSQRSLSLFNKHAGMKLDHQAGVLGGAGRDQEQTGPRLPANLQSRLQGRRRRLCEDRLPRGLSCQ